MKKITVTVERIENGWLVGYLGRTYFCATEWTLRDIILDAADEVARDEDGA